MYGLVVGFMNITDVINDRTIGEAIAFVHIYPVWQLVVT